MFGIGGWELVLILLLALILLGPQKLPKIAHNIGVTIAKFRKAADSLRAEVEKEVKLDEIKKQIEAEVQLKSVEQSIAESKRQLSQSVNLAEFNEDKKIDSPKADSSDQTPPLG